MGHLGTWDFVILGVAAFIAATTLVSRMRDYQARLLADVRAKLETAKAQREAEKRAREQEDRRRRKQEQEERERELYRERREQLRAKRLAREATANSAAAEDKEQEAA